MSVFFDLPDEAATAAFARRLAKSLDTPCGVILLQGDLGAGKTTLARACLRALGVEGRVVSPSYTLVEPYNAGPLRIFHMDLYRLSDPEELEYLGVRDFDPGADLLLVEWPEHGRGWLPAADLCLQFQDAPPGRRLACRAGTARGQQWLENLVADDESVG